MNDDPTIPKPAATLILVRCLIGRTPEIFLVKRHGRSGFMAGAHVFPGGRVDGSDAFWNEDHGLLKQSGPSCLWEPGEDHLTSLPFVIAAIRETAEECGVVFATDKHGKVVTPELAKKIFLELKRGASFVSLFKTHQLKPLIDGFAPFAWWVTPETESRRYNTRFFAACLPEGQIPGFDDHEVVDGKWFTPESAIEAYQHGKILLAPPTFAILEDLCGIRDFDALKTRAQNPLQPVCPVLTRDSSSDFVLALPGDPLHPSPHSTPNPLRTRIFFTRGQRFASAAICPSS